MGVRPAADGRRVAGATTVIATCQTRAAGGVDAQRLLLFVPPQPSTYAIYTTTAQPVTVLMHAERSSRWPRRRRRNTRLQFGQSFVLKNVKKKPTNGQNEVRK